MFLTTSSSQRTAYLRAFREYRDWSSNGDGQFLFVDEGRKYAFELFNLSADYSPTPDQIASDVHSLGWRIPAFFGHVEYDDVGHVAHGDRIGRGLPPFWAGYAAKVRLKEQRKGKRGRPTREERTAHQAFRERAQQRPTLEEMQAYTIRVRTAARLYLATGWLGAIVDLGGKMVSSHEYRGALSQRSGVSGERGGALIIRESNRTVLRFYNHSPHIEDFMAEHQIAEKAWLIRSIDMQVYVVRQMNKAAADFFRAAGLR